MRLFVFLVFFLLFLPSSRGQRSSCDGCDLHLVCNCTGRGFTSVPVVTARALTLDLSFNGIAAVTGDDLSDHARLEVLRLHANRLALIHPTAFDSLNNLQELDLSDNRLTALDHRWFSKLGALQELNLLHNPYRCLGDPRPFRRLVRLRRLALGGAALEEVQRGDLVGVTQLEELTLNANNLKRYDSGALGDVWPLGRVTLSLHGPVLTNTTMASELLGDVSYPETPIVLRDIHLIGNQSVQAFRAAAKRRIRYLTFHNFSVSDEGIVDLLVMLDGVPVTLLSLDGVVLTGEGRWERARWTDQKSIDDFYLRNVVVLDVYKFVSLLELGFLLRYPRKVSVINSQMFLIPCVTTRLLASLQYLDLSDNLLTDLTLEETLCYGNSTMKDLRVLNISGNALKSLSTMSRLVTRLFKLTHLDISRNFYVSMPRICPWPATLRFLNMSRTKLSSITPCLPASLEVLDLSNNDLKSFVLSLPALRELHLSGNKLLRLPPGWLFPNLQTLNIQSNTLSMFARSDLQSYRRLQDLQAGENKFVCVCDFVHFFQSAVRGDGDVRLTDGEDTYVCDSPLDLRGQPVVQVRLTVVDCQRVLFVSVCCGVALVLGILLVFVSWRLHVFWYLQMMWVWLRAKHSARRRRRDGTSSDRLLRYDAFVSYSERDASWVENFLVPELEEQRGSDSPTSPTSPTPLTLCLHKRDFLPGHWIVDNIMAAMESSRHTVFVLSENFVQSDWCRYELDFQVLDGSAGRDRTVLVLLEPLSRDDIPKRFCKLHKLMSSTTYLEWPQDEERMEEFWRSLRSALTREEEDQEDQE